MKFDINLTENEREIRHLLEYVQHMRNNRDKLLNFASDLGDKVRNYEMYIEELEKIRDSGDPDWMAKGEEPSEFYLNETQIDFLNHTK